MFNLPDLPYAYDALEPYIDEKTMRIHHTKHHGGYVAKLNDAVGNVSVSDDIEEVLRNLSDLPQAIQNTVRNNGGGHANHSLFWTIMTTESATRNVYGDVASAISRDFGDFENFKKEFAMEAMRRFGSGWIWLLTDKGKLSIMSTPNQDNPAMDGKTPILGLDVWEHAYYLLYQNRRADYVEQFFHVINWEAVQTNYQCLS